MKTIKVINNSNNDLPNFETTGAAAVDLRAWIKDANNGDKISYKGDGFNIVITEEGKIIIHLNPGGRILIPTGLHVSIPENTVLSIRPRSGLAIKNGITVLNADGTVDEDYRGDVGVILVNHGSNSFAIKNGDRIGQAILQSYHKFNWETVESLDETQRGEGGFGHTGS